MEIHKIPKAVTCHINSRDYYQLSIALKKNDLLEKLITDFYDNKIIKVIPNFGFPYRVDKDLPNDFVINSKIVEFETIFKRITKSDSLRRFTDNYLSNQAYTFAKKKNASLFLYSYYAYTAFKRAISDGLENKRILFQLHPHPISIKRILNSEIERYPFAEQTIKKELEFQISSDELLKLSDESKLAHHCMVASTFTKNTLIENNITGDNISVIPYGINQNFFKLPPIINKKKPKSTLNIIFVGQMVHRKGLADLLSAIRQINSKQINLTLCGRGIIDNHLLDQFKDVNKEICINLSNEQLRQKLYESDVFIFPSLIEGFAHVILEAMACGLPVIASSNTCAPDVITDGVEGFVIPSQNIEILVEKIQWCLENMNQLKDMAIHANLKAQNFTWEGFQKGILSSYVKLFN